MLLTGVPPALVNRPATTTSPLGSLAMQVTPGNAPPLTPGATVLHVAPSQRFRFTAPGPASMARRSPSGSASKTGEPPSPAPKGSQFDPSQRATRCTSTPPALVNPPPIARSPFGNVAIEYTV